MGTKWKDVYVFVSSTFGDMHAERDYIVKRVFPELQEWCERRKLRLVDIDLRWGVLEQDATYNKNVVRVCFHRIDECRPFFLCFLGQRYGWVPSQEDISADTYMSYPGLRNVAGKMSITELEVSHALISPFHGENRDCRELDSYYQPAWYSFFYFRDPSYLSQLPKEPPQLHSIYADPPGQPGEPSPLEALKQQKIPATRRPVRVYRAAWRAEIGYCTPELALPLVCPSSLPENIGRWQREWQRCAGIEVQGGAILDTGPKARQARDFNSLLTRGRLADFTGTLFDKGEEIPLSQVIINDLKEAIAERFPDHADVVQEDELQQELDQHEEFLFNHNQGYVERSGVFDDLDDYLRCWDDRRLFVLTAEGGMGKSSLLARWVERCLSGLSPCESGTTVHFRFVGASDRSASVDSLLRLLLRELKERHAKLSDDIPEDPEKLRLAWLPLLKAASQTGRMVLVLDGLNQLETGLRDLSWLPHDLPDGVKVVITFKRGELEAEALHQQYVAAGDVILAEVRPFDREEDRRRLVDTYLWQYLKQLDESAIQELISFPGATNPLFLKVVLAELRVFGVFAGLHEQIHGAFGNNPESAFEGMLRRLEGDPAHTALEARHTVRLLFGFLAHARRGLSSDELADLLLRHYPWSAGAVEDGRYEQVRDTLNLHLRQVRLFLARREGRYDFFYESFKTAAAQRYAEGGPNWHRVLSEHFEKQARTAPLDSLEKRYVVRVVFDVAQALQHRWLSQLNRSLTAQILSPEAEIEALSADPMQLLMELQQPFIEVLGLDLYAAGNLVIRLHEEGSCVVAEGLRKDQAEALAVQLMARRIKAEVALAASQEDSPWPSADPHPYAELLHHQVQARLWPAHAAVLADDAFRVRCMKFFGPRFFVQYFQNFVVLARTDAEAQPLLTELRLRMPINDYTQPLLHLLTEGLDQNEEEAAAFLLACARDPEQQGRAVIPLQALDRPERARPQERPTAVLQALHEALPLLLAAKDKDVRWLTVYLYWTLAPRGEAAPLLRLAEAEDEHPLIRAEAARQLGAVDDASLVPRLLRLTQAGHYPLTAMAERSARLIQQSLRLAPPAPIDDWSQPEDIPDDLEEVLRSLGVDTAVVDFDHCDDKSLLLIHLVLSSVMSVDGRWKEVEALYKVMRSLPCHLVCSEGGDQDCSLTPLKKLAGTEVWQKVALKFFHDFMIGSEEYLQLVTDYHFVIQGVEDSSFLVKGRGAKQLGQQALALAASVDRARAMLDNCLRKMRSDRARVAVLITHELPGYQISRLLGEEHQFISQMSLEAGMSASLGPGSNLLEAMLPEKVLPHLVGKPDDLIYVLVRMREPKGEVFGMDINYIHSLTGAIGEPSQGERGEERLTRRSTSKKNPRVLRGADLARAELMQADLDDANLAAANLEEANLRGASLGKAHLGGARLIRANLFQAYLNEADLSTADLEQVNLHGSSLKNANLRSARLAGAICISALFNEASLAGADLRAADLREADLCGACLAGADLSGARLEKARHDASTEWPDDFGIWGQGLVLVDPPIRLGVPDRAEAGLEVANLAVLARDRGERKKAEMLQQHAIALWEEAFGLKGSDLAICLNAFLRALQDRGHHEAALPLCRRALAIWQQVPASNPQWLATALNNLGLSLMALEQLAEAEQHLTLAVTTDPRTSAPFYWLAKLYQRCGQPGDDEREAAAWRHYLELGATNEERHREATARLDELRSCGR